VLANLAHHGQLLPCASGDVIFSTEPGVHSQGAQITLPAQSACIIWAGQ
jgi:hypothetical protein